MRAYEVLAEHSLSYSAIFSLFLTLLAFLAAVLFLGRELAYWLRIDLKDGVQQTFCSMLFGFLIWVCCLAVLCCGLKTSTLLVFPLLAFVRFQTRAYSVRRTPSSLLCVLCSAIIGFSASLYGYLSLDPNHILISDFRFYEDVAYMNSFCGVENDLGVRNCLLDELQPAPYHYLDLWTLSGFELLLPNYPRHQVLMLVAYPALWTLSILGTLAALRKVDLLQTKPTGTGLLILIAAISTLGFGMVEPNTFQENQCWMSLLHTPKLNVFYVWLILYFVCWNTELEEAGATCLLLCPILAAIAWPSFLTGSFIALLLVRTVRLKDWKQRIPFAPIMLTLALVAFYAVYNRPQRIASLWLARGPVYAGAKSLLLCMAHIPLAVIAVVFLRRTFPRVGTLCLVSASILSAGAFGWGLVYCSKDGDQIFTDIIVSFVVLIGSLASLATLHTFRKTQPVLALLLSVILAVYLRLGLRGYVWPVIHANPHSTEFLGAAQEILSLNQAGQPIIVGTVRGRDFYANPSRIVLRAVAPYAESHALGGYLQDLGPNIFVTPLDSLRITTDIADKEQFVRQLNRLQGDPYYCFAEPMEAKGQSEFSCILQFAKQNNIRYLLLEKGEDLTAEIQSRSIRIATDSFSGEVLVEWNPYR